MACIHCIAHCRDCKWTEENYNIARKKGREHAKKYGHIVDVETGNWYVYGKKRSVKNVIPRKQRNFPTGS